MKLAHALPVIMIALSCGAAIIYFAEGDTRRALYWAAAAILTSTVTF